MPQGEELRQTAAAEQLTIPSGTAAFDRLSAVPGVDDVDSYEALSNFIKVVSEGSGVSHFIMHARKCLLKGLSPHENRTIPPLRLAPTCHPIKCHLHGSVSAFLRYFQNVA